MWDRSLSELALARTIQADRLAEAERWRDARVARARSTMGRPRGDLAGWLNLTGEVVAGLDRNELEHRRRALRVVVAELVAGGRDAGLELAVEVEGDDDPVVLTRTLGWLAGRAARVAIPLSRTRRRRLARAIRRLTAGAALDPHGGPGEWRRAA